MIIIIATVLSIIHVTYMYDGSIAFPYAIISLAALMITLS